MLMATIDNQFLGRFFMFERTIDETKKRKGKVNRCCMN